MVVGYIPTTIFYFELHAAFGYLPYQFLADSSNLRTDNYGGSNENRNRFVVEIMKEMADAIGENKVAIRLSPTSTYNGITHQQPAEQFTLLMNQLNDLPLSYIHIMKVPYPADRFPQYPADAVETLLYGGKDKGYIDYLFFKQL